MDLRLGHLDSAAAVAGDRRFCAVYLDADTKTLDMTCRD